MRIEPASPSPGRQPRERPVPCRLCGYDRRTMQPWTWTMDLTGLCERHRGEA